MKICPNCERKYSDSLEYCLADGTVLSPMDDPNATLRFAARSTQTSTPARRNLPLFPFALGTIMLVGLIGIVAVVVLYLGWTKAAGDPRTPGNSSSSSGDPSSTDPRSAVVRETENLVLINSGLCVSMVQSDVAAINRLLSDDYSYSNDLGQSWSLNKEQTLMLYRMGRIRYESVTAPDPKVELNKELNKAVVSGRAYTRGTLDKKRFNNSYLYQNNYEKREDHWQLVKVQGWYR